MKALASWPWGRFVDLPLWLSTAILSAAAVSISAIIGSLVIWLAVGELAPLAFGLAFIIPGIVVPPAAALQLWAMRRARRSESELSRFFNTTDAIMVVGDEAGRLIRVNPACQKLLGYSAAEFAAGNFIQFVHPEDVALTQDEADRFDDPTHRSTAFVNRFQRKDGSTLWLQWNATADSKRRLIYATAIDVSARVETESFKDSLIATVNHEIRTPLTSLYGALRIVNEMQTSALPEDTRRMLGIAESSAERLVRIIDNTLDVERIQTGNVEYKLEPHRASALIDTAAEQARFTFEDAGIELVILDRSDGRQVLIDELRMQQVLGNLLANAAKFAPAESTVRLAAELDHGNILFSVADCGPGIPLAERERVFDRFYQVPQRKKAGSGLGLAISKTLVEGMNGRIAVEENPGGGATFLVRFPLCDAAMAETAARVPVS